MDKMRKYYIGFILLMLIVVAAVGYTFSQASAAKTDRTTNKAVEDISNKLDNYYYDHSSTPASLSDAGVKDVPSTVTYQRLSDLKYKVCFDYKTAATGFDAGIAAPFLGGFGSDSQSSTTTDHSYFDSSVEFTHKKGENCQTVTQTDYNTYNPLDSSGSSSGGASINTLDTNACDNYNDADTVSGDATVNTIDLINKKITFNPGNQYIYDKADAAVTISSESYDANTLFCDSSNNPTTASAVQAGKAVYIYMKSSTAGLVDRVDLEY